MTPTIRSGLRTMMRSDDGSSLILSIFFGFLALAVILVVTASTSLYLERKKLLSFADSAALVGAEAFELGDLSAVAVNGREPLIALTSADVARSVERFVADHPATSLESLTLDSAISPDGTSARVTVSSAWKPPVLTVFVPDGIRLSASSVARSVLR